MTAAAPFVKTSERWDATHLFEFLEALPPEAVLRLKQSQGLLEQNADKSSLKGPKLDARDLQKHLLWVSSNALAYPFKDETQLAYHRVVTSVAETAGVPKSALSDAPTFAIERELLLIIFTQLWDELGKEQRLELLSRIDPNGSIKDKGAIAALGGASALAALQATVMFSGFAFYTTMSVVIATVAGFFGITLPFAAYTSASAIVGFLSGPIGWAIMGVTAVGGLALAGKPNHKKTAAFIGQLHALKVEALMAAGASEREIFAQRTPRIS